MTLQDPTPFNLLTGNLESKKEQVLLNLANQDSLVFSDRTSYFDFIQQQKLTLFDNDLNPLNQNIVNIVHKNNEPYLIFRDHTQCVCNIINHGYLKSIVLLGLLNTPPKVLLLDELENGLDTERMEVVLTALKQLTQKGTQIYATTNSKELLETAVYSLKESLTIYKVFIREGEQKASRYDYESAKMMLDNNVELRDI